MPRPKSRTGSDAAADPLLPEKKKARQRLVGAIALCLLAAIVVPMLLESEPRTGLRSLPMTVENATETTRADRPWVTPPQTDDTMAMPDQVVMVDDGTAAQGASQAMPQAPGDLPGARLPGLGATDEAAAGEGMDAATGQTPDASRTAAARAAAARQAAEARQAAARAAETQAAAARKAQPGTAAAPAGQPGAAPATRPGGAQPLPKPLPMAQARQSAPADHRPDVLARLIDQVDAPAKGGRKPPAQQQRRFLVQVGAYSNVKSARAAVDRVSRAGFTAYQETVKSGNADWIRVRVGPFGSREDAERAQQALKQAGVTAALIAL